MDAIVRNLLKSLKVNYRRGMWRSMLTIHPSTTKDALAITGRGPIVRRFPMVPGIDFTGTVSASSHPEYQAGDKVLLTGWGVGEKHWGGLSEKHG